MANLPGVLKRFPLGHQAPARREFLHLGVMRGASFLFHPSKPVLVDVPFLILLLLPSVLPLTGPGYLQGSDAVDTPWRSLVLAQALRQWVLFPRWASDLILGYGYPIFNFYAPLSFYLVALLNIVSGVDLIVASNIEYGFNILLAGIGAYLLARRIVGRRSAALLAGVLYAYSPFTLGEVYVRSSSAGSAALGLLPFVLLAFLTLCRQPTLTATAVGALGVAAITLAHSVTAALALVMAAGFVVCHFFSKRDGRILAGAVLAAMLGLGVSSFFWLPAVAEMPYLHTENLYGGANDPLLHLVNPLGDVDPTIHGRGWWEDYEISSWGPTDLHLAYPYGPPPYKLSLLQGLLFLLPFGALIVVRRKWSAAVGSLTLLGVVLFFFHSTWSAELWRTFPPLRLLSFPWRLVGPLGLCTAVTAAWALHSLFGSKRPALLLLIGLAAILSSMWMLPTQLAPFEKGLEASVAGLLKYEHNSRNRLGTWAGNQLPTSIQWEDMASGDLVMRYDQVFPPGQWVGGVAFVAPDSKAWVHAARRGEQWMEARVEAAEDTVLSLHAIYFPGWTAYLDGRKVDVHSLGWYQSKDGWRAALGLSQVTVPPGDHLVQIVFEETPLRRFADGISVLSAVGIWVALLTAWWRSGAAKRWRFRVLLTLIPVVAGIAAAIVAFYGSSVIAETPWLRNDTVLDVLKQAEGKGLTITVPESGKPDDYVHVRDFTIQGETRPVLYMHPTSSVLGRVWLPERAKLSFAMGIDPAVWDKPGDGVQFTVLVRHSGKEETIFTEYIDPKNRLDDRRWVEGSVDLSRFAHEDVELVLATSPGMSADYDWAGWANPKVVVAGDESN